MESTAPARSKAGRWLPGQSANPRGRPPGSGRVAALRAGIAQHLPAIVQRLVDQAVNGDVQASRLLLERVLPSLRPVELPEPLSLPDGSLSDQGRAVLAAVAAGELSAGQASALLAGLGALAKLIEGDELARRLDALERQS